MGHTSVYYSECYTSNALFVYPGSLFMTDLASHISGDEPINEIKLKEVEKAVLDAGVALGQSDDAGGWEQGTVWLVPTDRSITEWKPIATRSL